MSLRRKLSHPSRSANHRTPSRGSDASSRLRTIGILVGILAGLAGVGGFILKMVELRGNGQVKQLTTSSSFADDIFYGFQLAHQILDAEKSALLADLQQQRLSHDELIDAEAFAGEQTDLAIREILDETLRFTLDLGVIMEIVRKIAVPYRRLGGIEDPEIAGRNAASRRFFEELQHERDPTRAWAEKVLSQASAEHLSIFARKVGQNEIKVRYVVRRLQELLGGPGSTLEPLQTSRQGLVRLAETLLEMEARFYRYYKSLAPLRRREIKGNFQRSAPEIRFEDVLLPEDAMKQCRNEIAQTIPSGDESEEGPQEAPPARDEQATALAEEALKSIEKLLSDLVGEERLELVSKKVIQEYVREVILPSLQAIDRLKRKNKELDQLIKSKKAEIKLDADVAESCQSELWGHREFLKAAFDAELTAGS